MAFSAYLLENAMLVLARGGAFAHFFLLHRGAFTAFPKKMTNAWGNGGMGRLGIEWTIIDEAEGQDGCILAKFLFLFLLTESRTIDSHLDRTSLVNKGFIIIYGQKDNIFSGKNERNPSPAWLANQNAGFRLILPAYGFSHIIIED